MAECITGPSAAGYVPVIDLAAPRGSRQRKQAAEAVDTALRTSGFFLAVGHGIDLDRVHDLIALARVFFHAPTEAKDAVAANMAPPRKLGWTAMDTTNVAATYGQDTLPDICETFSFTWPDQQSLGENQWPPALEGFADACIDVFREFEGFHDEVLRLAARALDLPENWFAPFHEPSNCPAVINWYPQRSEPPRHGRMRKGEHTDWGTFTVLWQHDDGLEVRGPDGTWVPVPAVPGSVVVNTGDMMAHWTNHRWVSNPHRVPTPSGDDASSERFSLAWFGQPAPDAVIETIATCVRPGEHPAPAITAQKYLDDKLAAMLRSPT